MYVHTHEYVDRHTHMYSHSMCGCNWRCLSEYLGPPTLLFVCSSHVPTPPLCGDRQWLASHMYSTTTTRCSKQEVNVCGTQPWHWSLQLTRSCQGRRRSLVALPATDWHLWSIPGTKWGVRLVREAGKDTPRGYWRLYVTHKKHLRSKIKKGVASWV